MRYISIFDTKSVHDSTTVRCTFYHLNLFFNRLQVILPFATQKRVLGSGWRTLETLANQLSLEF